MSENFISSYTKPGATFISGQEALADKNSLYGPALTDSVYQCYGNMQAAGILLEPITPVWDQANCTLNVIKKVTSTEAYLEAVTFDKDAVVAGSKLAGWTFILPQQSGNAVPQPQSPGQ